MNEEVLDSKVVFDGELFRVVRKKVRLPNGKIAEREISETKFASVAVMVLDQNQNIYLVKEYKTGAKEARLGMPGGRFYPETGETPEAAAIRESREEVGMEPRDLELLFEVRGGRSWGTQGYCYLGTNAIANPKSIDWDEHLEVVKMPFRKYLDYAIEKPDYLGRAGTEIKAAVLVAKKLGYLQLKS